MKKEKKIGSNRSFGIIFSVFFSFLAIYPAFNGSSLNYYLLGIALIFLFLGLINSTVLNPLNILWIKFGELLGTIVAPIVMLMVYIITIVPTGIIMRLFGKDLLNLKYNRKVKSYWIEKNHQNQSSMKDQF